MALTKLEIRLEAETTRLQKDLDKADRKIKRFAGKATKSSKSVSQSFKQIGLAATAATVGLGLFVKTSISAADTIAKMSDALGLSTKAFQEYSFGAELAGVNQSQFTSNLTAFVKRVGEARSETGPLVSFLKKYDEELLVAIQRSASQEEALGLVADAVKNAATATDQAAIANAAFSRAGVTMVNFLKDGAAGLDEYTQKAQELGLVMDEAMLRNAEKAEDQMTILSKTISIKATSAVVKYADKISALSDKLLTFIDVASQAPAFIQYLAESFAAAVHGPADPVRIADRIEVLREKINNLSQGLIELQERTGISGTFGRLLSDSDDYYERINVLGAELQKLLTLQETFITAPPPILTPLEGGEPRDVRTADDELNKQEEIWAEQLKLQKKMRDEEVKLEQQKSAMILSMRANVANASIGFLSLFADKSKAIAKVIIVVEKALSIAQAIQNTAVAVMKSYTIDPFGGLAARISLMGKVQVGLIAATGLGQLAGAGGGGGGGAPSIGGGGGGGAIPVDNPYTPTAEPQQSQTTFIIVGDSRFDENNMDSIMDEISERINEGSQIVIRRDSPQAQEIALAARNL